MSREQGRASLRLASLRALLRRSYEGRRHVIQQPKLPLLVATSASRQVVDLLALATDGAEDLQIRRSKGGSAPDGPRCAPCFALAAGRAHTQTNVSRRPLYRHKRARLACRRIGPVVAGGANSSSGSCKHQSGHDGVDTGTAAPGVIRQRHGRGSRCCVQVPAVVKPTIASDPAPASGLGALRRRRTRLTARPRASGLPRTQLSCRARRTAALPG